MDDVEKFWKRVEKTDTCWLWVGRRSMLGYGRVYLGGGRKKPRIMFAHRFVWQVTNGDIPSGTTTSGRGTP